MGALSCWNSNLYDCTEVLVRKFSLTTRLVHRSSNTSFYLTNVYGPPSWGGKASFCAELAELKDSCNGLWVMCGDFNLTRSPLERKGRSWCKKLMSMFSDLINELQLIDLPLGNQNFTWSNMQDQPTLAKLDQFLVSTEWDQAFPLSKVMAAPRITSDHSLIHITTSDVIPRRTFRFENVWLGREEFRPLVAVWWNEVANKRTNCLCDFLDSVVLLDLYLSARASGFGDQGVD